VVVPGPAPTTPIEQLFPEVTVHMAGEGRLTPPLPFACEKLICSPAIDPKAPASVAVQVAVSLAGIDDGVHSNPRVGFDKCAWRSMLICPPPTSPRKIVCSLPVDA
jgi:hypothetical protein